MKFAEKRDQQGAPQSSGRWVPWLPGLFVSLYLAGTAGLYLSMAASDPAAPAYSKTVTFVVAVAVAVLGGYSVGIFRHVSMDPRVAGEDPSSGTGGAPVPALHLLIVAAAGCWWLLFGIASMLNRGITGPGAVLSRVTDPRASYYAKFDEVGAAASPLLQLLTLCGLLYWLLIPFTVLYWRRLPLWSRALSISGVASYVLLFLSTGTQKGIVDVCLQGGVSILVVAIARGRVGWRRPAAVGLLVLLGLGTVVTSLGQRTDATSSIMQLPGNTAAAATLEPVLGDVAARGTVVTRDYITEGYRGLGYGLELPFEWTYGVGSMRSLSSYLPQYLGVHDPYEQSYPVRIDQQFGWSATEKWATVYPWLASDLTFPGTVGFMALLGWLLARGWVSFLRRRDPWSLAGLVVLAVFFLFAPANNQLFNDRYTALGVLALLVVLSVRGLRRRVRKVEDAHRLVTRAANFVVRSGARWRRRVWLELVNRCSRRPVVDPDGIATVSITTFAPRLRGVHVALESIARGTARPARMVLWVDTEVAEQARSAAGLRRLQRRGLEIRDADASLGPHKKYVHVLEETGSEDLVLVVADDDIMYPRFWLDELLTRFDECAGRSVVSWWAKSYRLGSDGNSLMPYDTWESVTDTSVRRDHYLMGGSGTIFPRRVLDQLRAGGREFLGVAPRADDVWLNLATVRAGVGVAQVRPLSMPILTVPLTQRSKLSLENVVGGLNDEQIRKAFDSADLASLRNSADMVR